MVRAMGSYVRHVKEPVLYIYNEYDITPWSIYIRLSFSNLTSKIAIKSAEIDIEPNNNLILSPVWVTCFMKIDPLLTHYQVVMTNTKIRAYTVLYSG